MKTVRVALAGATLWSAALVAAALTVPLYSGASTSSVGSADTDSNGTVVTGPVTTTSTTATLVEVNGWWGLVLACIPLCACLVVATLLLGPGGRRSQVAAAVVVAPLGAVTVLGLLTIGLFLVPAVAGLGVAVLAAVSAGPTEVTT